MKSENDKIVPLIRIVDDDMDFVGMVWRTCLKGKAGKLKLTDGRIFPCFG